MKKNMGTFDRAIRIIVAIVLLILIFSGQITGTLAYILGIISIVFLITSTIGWCYPPFPLHTGSSIIERNIITTIIIKRYLMTGGICLL